MIRDIGYPLPSYVYENTQGECSDILILPSVYTIVLLESKRMRYIEIDGHRVEVDSCKDCPCFMDVDYYGNGFCCNHPMGDVPEEWGYGKDCPLREVE